MNVKQATEMKKVNSDIINVFDTADKKKGLIEYLSMNQTKYDVTITKVGEPNGINIWKDKKYIKGMLEDSIYDLQKILNNLKK